MTILEPTVNGTERFLSIGELDKVVDSSYRYRRPEYDTPRFTLSQEDIERLEHLEQERKRDLIDRFGEAAVALMF